jgi:hypothetical protein
MHRRFDRSSIGAVTNAIANSGLVAKMGTLSLDCPRGSPMELRFHHTSCPNGCDTQRERYPPVSWLLGPGCHHRPALSLLVPLDLRWQVSFAISHKRYFPMILPRHWDAVVVASVPLPDHLTASCLPHYASFDDTPDCLRPAWLVRLQSAPSIQRVPEIGR